MRIAIVLDETLGPGFLANAAACIASGLFNGESHIRGPEITGTDINYIPITNIACLILKQNRKPWKELLQRAQKNGLKYMLFTKEAQSTTSYGEYIQRVEKKPIEEVTVIGIGVLGEDSQVTKFSGDLPRLR
jgi:hypothetical protein